MKYWEKPLEKYMKHMVTREEIRNNPRLRAFRRIRIAFALVNPAISVVILSLLFLGVF
ncbi:MAG: hypothetical protein M1431_06695 [Candidatus Thermoplasmatota archaeon]|nr:hypothetical protein [Candidatus Thermoplasmatota archaeon]